MQVRNCELRHFEAFNLVSKNLKRVKQNTIAYYEGTQHGVIEWHAQEHAN